MSEPLNFGIQYRNGSHRGPAAPTNCRSCGRPMRVYQTNGEWRAAEPKFNSDGTPNVILHARCTAPWWRFGMHDHAIADDYGDWPWL